MMILPTPRLNVYPTPNEIQVAAAELDRLIFKNQKQEGKKKNTGDSVQQQMAIGAPEKLRRKEGVKAGVN